MAVKECCCVKLSPNKKSIRGMRMRSTVLYFLLVSSCLGVAGAEAEVSCSEVKSIFEKREMVFAADLQEQPTSDGGGLCGARGCCGAGARSALTQAAGAQLDAALHAELAKLADILATRAQRFDEFFRKLLKTSRQEFHTMFKRTYGMIYEQHSYVFEQLFEELERYYTRGDTDFDQMMDGFFTILYQKMFTVLNAQYMFSDKYLKCVGEHMREIEPFEDVPSKLSVQLRRAFVATRTFHKALRAGADVVRNMQQVRVSGECRQSWARLRHCGGCSGSPAPACSRYCHNVLRACLAVHADLADHWDLYVDAVEKVADRLLGPFNIAMVVEPIDIKISEAIMSFQEHNQEISQKIFAGCGKPTLGGGGGPAGGGLAERARRSARQHSARSAPAPPPDVGDFELEASFESLVKDDPALAELQSGASIRRVTRHMQAQARERARFLRYLRAAPPSPRPRRDASPQPEAAPDAHPQAEIDYRPYDFDGRRGSKKRKPAPKAADSQGAEWSGPALERLVRETRARLRSSRQYWARLPPALCSPASVTTQPCFNGTHVASYTRQPAGDGTAALESNPEARLPDSAGAALGAGAAAGAGADVQKAQQETLRTLTARLKDAYNGVEVQWKDSDELQASRSSISSQTIEAAERGSGSGSGDGEGYDSWDDGYRPDDDEDSERPDDDFSRYPEGSGDWSAERTPGTTAEVSTRAPAPAAPPAPAPSPPTPPPAPAPPAFVPGVVDAPDTNNVHIRGRIADAPPPPPARDDSAEAEAEGEAEGGAEGGQAEAAAGGQARAQLHSALFSYALPVVCAWFGSLLTDLF